MEWERLEVNRERIAGNLEASSSTTVPAVEGKFGCIPKHYCVKWNKTGSCSNDQCKFKHEKPAKREKGVPLGPVNVEDLLPGTMREKGRRSASSGSRQDVTVATNASLSMKGSLIVLPGLQRLKAQWINHASKKQEGGGVVGDCEMPEMPRTSGGAPAPGLNAAMHEQFEPNQPSSSRDNPYPQKGKDKGKGKRKHRRWVRLSGKGVSPILGSGTPKADGSGNGIEHLEIPNLILLPCLHCITIKLD